MYTPLIAVGLGLLGSTHCLAMCGGIAGAQSLAIDRNREGLIASDGTAAKTGSTGLLVPVVVFNLSRLASYALLGLILGSFGAVLAVNAAALVTMRSLAGLLLIAMGLYVGQWWSGLIRLERAGSGLWRQVQRVLPARSAEGKGLGQSIAAGLAWGLLPCGLVYSALVWSFSRASGPEAALLMLCFGIGTLPSMISAGLLTIQIRRILQKRSVRKSAAVLLVLYGLWTIPWMAIHGLINL